MGAKLCIFSDKVQKNLEKYPYIYISIRFLCSEYKQQAGI